MNIFTASNSFLKRLRYRQLDPTRDWLVLLTFSVIVLAGIIIWNVWAFDTVANGGIIGAPATTTTPVFSQDALNVIKTVFTNRAEEETEYETGVYRFADPSQ